MVQVRPERRTNDGDRAVYPDGWTGKREQKRRLTESSKEGIASHEEKKRAGRNESIRITAVR